MLLPVERGAGCRRRGGGSGSADAVVSYADAITAADGAAGQAPGRRFITVKIP